jgi:hypothetical protein
MSTSLVPSKEFKTVYEAFLTTEGAGPEETTVKTTTQYVNKPCPHSLSRRKKPKTNESLVAIVATVKTKAPVVKLRWSSNHTVRMSDFSNLHNF